MSSTQPVQVLKLPIITTETKQNLDFQNHLGSLARSDAHHDLGDAFKTGEYNSNTVLKDVFNSGLPPARRGQMTFKDYHETGSLASVILKIGDSDVGITYTEHKGFSAFKELLSQDIIEANRAAPGEIPSATNCQIGYRTESGGSEDIFQYNVVKFSNGGRDFDTETFAQEFLRNTALCGEGTEFAVIVDFVQCKFLELFAGCSKLDNYTLHYLMTPEMVNDPAGKPSINNETLFKQTDKGINMKSYIQIDTEPMSYSSFDIENPDPNNNFYSKYDFKLTPIQQIISKQKKSDKLISTLNISLTEGGTLKPLVTTIDDAKAANSINSVLGYLRKIIANISSVSNGTESGRIAKFNFNSKCQQKRSGDWFQALCCLDARNRNYVEILPSDKRPAFKLKSDCPVYFVTHDQIAVAYALLNGINVIYFSANKQIFVFKNNSDLTVQGNGKPVAEIYFNKMLTDYPLDNKTRPLITELLGFAKAYQVGRLATITTETEAFTSAANQQVVEETNVNFMKIVQIKFRAMFEHAVRLMFVKINLTNVDAAITYINSNSNIILNTAYDAKNDAQIISLNKSIALINSVLNRFGRVPPNVGVSFSDAINKWIGENVRKLDVYKAAQQIDLYDALSTTTADFDITQIDRLKNYSSEESMPRKTDKYIFLPFIQTLDYEMRQQIVQNLRLLIEPLKSFAKTNSPEIFTTIMNKFKAAMGSKPRVTGQIKFYNNSANLIFESIILLDTKPPPPAPDVAPVVAPDVALPAPVVDVAPVVAPDDDVITAADILVLFSADDVIVNEDLSEILILLNGKFSNDTASEKENADQTGGKNIYDAYANDTPGGNTICDVGVKQMTYPLLGNTLVDMLVKFASADDVADDTEFIEDTDGKAVPSAVPDVNRRAPLSHTDTAAKLRAMFDADNVGWATRTGLGDGTTVGGGPNEFLLEDYNLGYHPLVPIYMLLSPFYYSLGPKYNSYPYFNTYFTYFNILNKMVTVLQTNYLKNPSDTEQITDGYLIGFGLGHMLFTSNSSLVLTNAILASIEMEQSEYYNFSLKNDTLASLITGSIHLNAREEQSGVDLLTNSVFKQFINEEVNFKQMLGEDIPSEGLTYVTLQQNVLALLKTIAAKIKNDRNPNSWEKAKLRNPVVQGISSSQLSTISMNTGRTNTPDTLTSSSLTPPITVGVGGFLKTKKQKRKSKKNLKTKRRKNKQSNKKSKKNHRRRKQRKQTRKH